VAGGRRDRGIRRGDRRVRIRHAQRSQLVGPHTLFWALLDLIAFGIVAIIVSMPNGNVIYAVAGLVVFGAFTIFDFNRLRRSSPHAAVSIAAGIFLDVSNIFLLALELFGGQRD
jgi:FtsH-binding integral membrane protein